MDECYNGRGIRFDVVASRLTSCIYVCACVLCTILLLLNSLSHTLVLSTCSTPSSTYWKLNPMSLSYPWTSPKLMIPYGTRHYSINWLNFIKFTTGWWTSLMTILTACISRRTVLTTSHHRQYYPAVSYRTSRVCRHWRRPRCYCAGKLDVQVR